MAVRRLRVRNFKSFRNVEVQLSPLTALVGANASGKSNFVQLFRFLRDIARMGLENAISLQGGAEYLLNRSIGTAEPLEVELEADIVWQDLRHTEEAIHVIRGETVRYGFSLHFEDAGDVRVGWENFRLDFAWSTWQLPLEQKEQVGPSSVEHFTLEILRDGTSQKFVFPENLPINIHELWGIVPSHPNIFVPDAYANFPLSLSLWLPECSSKDLLIEQDKGYIKGDWRSGIVPFAHAGVYDFDSKRIRESFRSKDLLELREDGSNLPAVLRRILRHPENARQFRNLLSVFLPFVKDVEVQALPNLSLMVSVQEEFGQTRNLPASFLSEGTVEILALITALYFTEPRSAQLLVIEEPDRHLHPHLAERLVGVMQEVSAQRQVIFTTHSAEVVRYLPLESLLLVSRDREGFSTVTRPADSEQVQDFLKEQIGLSFLFTKELLGA